MFFKQCRYNNSESLYENMTCQIFSNIYLSTPSQFLSRDHLFTDVVIKEVILIKYHI